MTGFIIPSGSKSLSISSSFPDTVTGWPLCADNKLACSPVLEEVTLIFLKLKVGHSSELRREGSFGLSTSSSRMAIGFRARFRSGDGGDGAHKSMIQTRKTRALGWLGISKRQLVFERQSRL